MSVPMSKKVDWHCFREMDYVEKKVHYYMEKVLNVLCTACTMMIDAILVAFARDRLDKK